VPQPIRYSVSESYLSCIFRYLPLFIDLGETVILWFRRILWFILEVAVRLACSKVALEADLVVEMLQAVQAQLSRVDRAIQKIAEGFEEYDYLKSIPGFGPYVSAVAFAAIGNAHRFENRAQLIRLAGFDLSANRSGEKSKSAVPVISKKGKADLRYALYQAALVACSLTSHFRAYYSRLLDGRQREQGIRTKMLVKIAAKMLLIAWTLME
jgi:transposase